MELTTGGWLTWYTKSDRYSRTKLNSDLEKLRAYYLNRGYLEFDITSTQVTISPDKQSITITITIAEGQPYVVTGVRLEGNYLGARRSSATWSRSSRAALPRRRRHDDDPCLHRPCTAPTATRSRTSSRGRRPNRATGQVWWCCRPTRAGAPTCAGSTSRATRSRATRSIRREFRQLESAWYDGSRIKLSRDRVDRLGFFSSVDVDTAEVPGRPRPGRPDRQRRGALHGNLTLPPATRRPDKLSVTGSVRRRTCFGTGNFRRARTSARRTRTATCRSARPTRTSRTTASRAPTTSTTARSRPLNSSATPTRLTPGAAIRFGLPYSEFDTVFVGIGAEQTHIGTSLGVPNSYVIFVDRVRLVRELVPDHAGWARDQRDIGVAPTSGRYVRLNSDFSAVGDVQYAA
jgi:outer membrane protein insertion porin family